MSTAKRTKPPFASLRSHEVTPIDLFILDQLKEGASEKEISEKIKEKFGATISRSTVRERIETLKAKGIIRKIDTIAVNPAKLYDFLYLAFVKTSLTSILGPAGAIPWREAYERILKVNEKYGNPIKILFNVGGTGEYDFVMLIYVNDTLKYHEFKEALVKETGIIEKFDSKYVELPELLYYNPISIPDYEEYRDSLIFYQKAGEKILKREQRFLGKESPTP